MKVYSLLAASLLAFGVTAAHAQMGPDDQFVTIYGMIQQADALADAGQAREAVAEYTAAQAELQKFARIYPTWSPNIITFRERYLADKIASTTAVMPAAPAAVATATMMPAATNVTGSADDPLNELRQQVQGLQNDNANLAAKLKEALTTQPASADPQQLAAAQDKIQALTKENDLLQASLNTQKASTPAAKISRSAARKQIDELEEQVKSLQARVSADEAQPVPYSAAELALFQPTTPVLAATAGPTKVENQPPTGADDLVASAKAHFADHDYDKAAADYQKILQLDKNNAYALANLATIELQQGQLANAERDAQAALAQNANDPYSLSVLGNVKFQQGKYDESLEVLSKGAALDPQNPTIQSLLGVCLGHKGMRLQAETALRKAILIDPNFAAAHYNLAVVYLGEQPPRAGLARFHYLKALANGQPHNPDFEKLLSDNGAGITAQ